VVEAAEEVVAAVALPAVAVVAVPDKS